MSEYSDLLENNPRAMKRLLNSYGVERDRLLREDNALSLEERRQLVLFTIFRLRWPQFAEHLLRHPKETDWLSQATPSPGEDHAFRTLFFDDDVRQFFDASELEVALDATVFIGYSGRGDVPSPTVGA